MNIMRKFLGGAPAGGGVGQPPDSGGAAGVDSTGAYRPEQELLGLNHLRKLYSEYSQPAHPLSTPEREGRLYAMLPLFCKIFNSVPARLIGEKFAETSSFAQACSKLLVTEVRRRASNQSTEAAASAIAEFLELGGSEEQSMGWMLLSTLNLLAAEGNNLVEVMTAASVPSTLVKCLYLFFDLPEDSNSSNSSNNSWQEEGGEQNNESEFTPRERRILLQKMFMQVLIRLCSHVAAVEELARKDDLTLLFSAISSACPAHNACWRKTASDVLLTVSRHALSQPVISYLHNKGCIAMCIENMQKVAPGSQEARSSSEPAARPLDTVEMVVSVFCFIKDSALVSQTLLDDFRTCQGYVFLSEFLLRLEHDSDPESSEAIRNLVLLVASLTFCGHAELAVPPAAASSSLYQLPDFQLPQPENRGATVRNLQAFQVLQSVFLKCESVVLGGTILDAISTIYHGDNANYFLLQNQHTLSQAAERIGTKPPQVQEKFFQLVEFLVHHLHYIPTKELIAVSLILKSKRNLDCCVLAVQCLISILKFDPIFKDVFREVGMVEVLVCCLSLYTDYLGAGLRTTTTTTTQDVYQPSMVPLGEMVIITLTELLTSSAQNAGVFRELGGAGLAGQLIQHADTRDAGLSLLQQLIVAAGPGAEEDMTGLLELLHHTPATDLTLRTSILKCLAGCLKDSHRSRTVFRRIGGFVYIMSVLVGLEDSLADDPERPTADKDRRAIFDLLREIFVVLAVAMRYEPANARFFQQEIARAGGLGEALRLLGCFSPETRLRTSLRQRPSEEVTEVLQLIFSAGVPDTEKNLRIAQQPESCVLILRLLYDLAVDNFKAKTKSASSTPSVKSEASSLSLDSQPGTPNQRSRVPSLNLFPRTSSEPVLVHPGVCSTILHLLPGFYHENHPEVSASLHLFAAETIKSLLRTEKNQQIMCDADFVSELLAMCGSALEDDSHLLHSPCQYLLERLTAQKLSPADLRAFLRLGNPLASLSEDQLEEASHHCGDHLPPANQRPGSGGFVPLARIKTLVSMTTPKELHILNNSILPPFVEFDMASEGFGCLFIPSLAPQPVQAPSVVGVNALAASQDCPVIGGVGLGERLFPPPAGLTFSTWICIDKFSDPRADPHPVRLLTVARQVRTSGAAAVDAPHMVCLAVALSTRDKAIVVSVQESSAEQASDWQPEYTGEWGSRVWFPDIMKEGEWHHLVFVFTRQVMKNSALTLYVNGTQVTHCRMNYINQSPGGSSGGGSGGGSVVSAASVYAWIGTPPAWRRPSRLCWKQGPCLLLEEAASAQLAGLLWRLGPHYLGSLQAPQLITTSGEVLGSQLAEERILLGLNAVAMTEMTLAKIRKVYSRVDNKSIAKQLGMNTSENATPIRVIHNSAGHLAGSSRSLGGVVIGYLGVRVFTPQPVSKAIQTVGGCSALLGLIAMARDVESLYAGVKALVCVLKSNPFARVEMEQAQGYRSLAMLLRKKSASLNSHILHLIFTLVGTVEAGGGHKTEAAGIPNQAAFKDLLCDLELWHAAPAEVEKSLFEHFFELLSDTGVQRNAANIKILRDYHLVEKLLAILKKSEGSSTTTLTLLNVLHALLCTSPRVTDVICFTQFTAATLHAKAANEGMVTLAPGTDGTECRLDDHSLRLSHAEATIILRNRCLKLFFSLLYMGKKINSKYCEEMTSIVGFDWVQLFLQAGLHPTTVIWALRILMTLVAVPGLLARFREGSCNGGWLMKSELVLQNKMGAALGQILSSSTKVKQMRIRQDIFTIPGFQLFNWLMPRHIAIPEVYYLLLAMVLGQPVKRLPDAARLDLDSVWNYVFGTSSPEVLSSDLAARVTLCGEAMVTVLTMVRTMLNMETKNPDQMPDWLKEYPVTLTQFLFYLYHNVHDFMPVFMGPNVLTALAGTLFPMVSPPSQPTSPVNNASSPSTEDRPVVLHLPSQDDSLTNHPAKRNVMTFLRVMVVDSLSLAPSPKLPPVIDSLLDAQPELSTTAQQNRFQTDLLTLIMDHLVDADILIGEQAALPIVPGGSSNHVAPNVFYLASRLVDKLWQAVFRKDANEVFQFILKLILQAKRRSTSLLSLEGIFRSLNRTILFMLSRPIKGLADQTAVMEVLHKLITHRAILFGRDNPEIEFFGCLTYCLVQLTAGLVIPIDGAGGPTTTRWHVSPTSPAAAGDETDSPDAVVHQGQNLLNAAANRVWEEMYFNKKSAIEEVTKVSFPSGNKTPSLESVRDLVAEPAGRVWAQYTDMERRACYQRIPAWEIHTHIQSRIQKVAGGLTGGLKRLASVSGSGGGGSSSGGNSGKNKKEEEKRIEQSMLPQAEVEAAVLNHIAIVAEVVEQHGAQRQQTEHHLLKFTEEEWLVTEGQLTRERGLWGPPAESPLVKWQLDVTEGPLRMRKRMLRDEMFFYRYPYRPRDYPAPGNSGDTAAPPPRPLKYKRPTSRDSKVWYERHQSLALFEREEGQLELDYDDCDVAVKIDDEDDDGGIRSIDDQIRQIGFKGLKSVPMGLGDEEDEEEEEPPTTPATATGAAEEVAKAEVPPMEELSSAYQTVMRLLENGERISAMYRCARIQGLDIMEGLLLFGKEHFYVVDGFTIVNHREVHDIDFIPANQYDPIIPTVPGQMPKITPKRQVSKFAYDDVKEVHKRRYLLQPIAVEVFSTNGQNYLLAFQRTARGKVYQRFSLLPTASLLENAAQSVAGQGRSANVEQAAGGLFSALIGETSVTQRWVRGEISNFQYLMSLNTLAGRSYNDLMQYPIFPWILADYTSEELDLTNPKTFRDLSKPMGAQTAHRLEQFKKRFKDWDDAGTDSPPYHYGTHYSSAMIVSSYLVRLEPFTQHFLHLQGGHFDLADRMFHSVSEAWDSSSKNNMADVRELIPEFFYLPDFLTNRNNFDLGLKQSGEMLDHVLLPPWAKNDTREFIRVHREALESDHVSAHLHKWIDLIFGYRQSGEAAVEAANVFHHLFYEGNVDIFAIEDPLQRNATIGFINNFGQIPKQLFKKPHPVKKVITRTNSSGGGGTVDVASATTTANSKIFFHHVNNLRPSMGPVKELKGPVGEIQPTERMVYAVEQNKVLVPGNANRYLAWGFADQSFRLCNYDTDRAVFICEPSYLVGEVLTCVCPNPRLVLTAGTSTLLTVWLYDKRARQLRFAHSLYGHTEAVTCLAASPAWGLAVSGSRDASAILWDLARFAYIKSLPGHAGPVAAVSINELTGDIVTCAGSHLYLWDVNGVAIAAVDTSPPPSLPAVSQHDKGGGGPTQILCVAQSQMNEWDRENVIITGGNDGVVRMWSLDYVEIPVGSGSSGQPTAAATTAATEQSSLTTTADGVSTITQMAKKMSVSLSGDCLSSLREAVARQHKTSVASERSVEDQSSDTEDCDDLVTDDRPSDSEDLPDGGEASPDDVEEEEAESPNADANGPTRDKKPDDGDDAAVTLPEINVVADDSFVVIEAPIEEGVEALSTGVVGGSTVGGDVDVPAMITGDGYTWSRQLVFRAKLTMHTAFERSDNSEPAAVTALAVSKDHKNLYVGDDRGRVFSWQVSNKPGKGFVDHWMKDEGTDCCKDCKVRFTIYERRHHCRNCGSLFCSACSRYQAEIPRLRIHQEVRVCRRCHVLIKSSSS